MQNLLCLFGVDPINQLLVEMHIKKQKMNMTRVQKNKNIEKKLAELADELKVMLNKEQQFIGFKARHRYRANNNAGQTVFGEMEYMFDKDISRIITAYDMEDNEYRAVQIIYRQILNEDKDFNDSELLD